MIWLLIWLAVLELVLFVLCLREHNLRLAQRVVLIQAATDEKKAILAKVEDKLRQAPVAEMEITDWGSSFDGLEMRYRWTVWPAHVDLFIWLEQEKSEFETKLPIRTQSLPLMLGNASSRGEAERQALFWLSTHGHDVFGVWNTWGGGV